MTRLAVPVLATGLLCASLTLRAGTTDAPRPAPAVPAPMSYAAQNEAIKQFCVGCHNDTAMRGNLSLA